MPTVLYAKNILKHLDLSAEHGCWICREPITPDEQARQITLTFEWEGNELKVPAHERHLGITQDELRAES